MIKEIFYLPGNILKGFWNILSRIFGFMGKSGKEASAGIESVSEFVKYRNKFKTMKVLFFTDTHVFETSGKTEANSGHLILDNIDGLFKIDHLFTDVYGNPVAVIYDNFPKTVDFSETPQEDEFKIGVPVTTNPEDDQDKAQTKNIDASKLKTTISFKKYKIYGGKILSQVAYYFFTTIFMNLLRPVARDELRSAMLMTGAICLFIGYFGGILSAGLLF